MLVSESTWGGGAGRPPLHAPLNCSRCGYGILEIKCPYKYRYCQPLEAIHMMPCTRLAERVYYVNENSSWYSQAQVQLLCTNANFCDFVIYTFKVEECKSHVLIRTLSYFSKWKR